VECCLAFDPHFNNPWNVSCHFSHHYIICGGVPWHFSHRYANRVMFLGTSAIAIQTVWCFLALQPSLRKTCDFPWHFSLRYSNSVMFLGTSAISIQTVWCFLALQPSLRKTCDFPWHFSLRYANRKPCDVPWQFSNRYANRVMFFGTSAIAMQTVWCSLALQPPLSKTCGVPWHFSQSYARLSGIGLHNPRPNSLPYAASGHICKFYNITQ